MEPMPNPPQQHEIEAAFIVAEHFKSDIIFLRSGNGKTPDFKIVRNNELWELKSPCGNSKKTMENNLRNAKKQSYKILMSLLRCKMNKNQAIARIDYFLKHDKHNIKNVKVVLKDHSVIDIFNKNC